MPGTLSLDDLIAAIRDVLAGRFPAADWASLVIHQPETPNTVLVIRPRPASESASDSLPPRPVSP